MPHTPPKPALRRARLLAILAATCLAALAHAQPADEDESPAPPPQPQPSAQPEAVKPAPELSKEELAELKALYNASSPDEQERLKAYYADMGVQLEKVGVAEAADQTGARVRTYTEAMKGLTRTAQEVLSARATLAVGMPYPNIDLPDAAYIARWVRTHTVAGEWDKLGEFLRHMRLSEGKQLYWVILQSLTTGEPGLLPEEVVSLSDASPAEPEHGQIDLLARLLQSAVGKQGQGTEALLKRLAAGTRWFGSVTDEHKARTERLLAKADLMLQAFTYLPSLEDARARGDAQVMVDRARYQEVLASRQVEGPEPQALRRDAWSIFCEVTLMKKAPPAVRRQAAEHCINLVTALPRSLVQGWLAPVFEDDSIAPVVVQLLALKAVQVADESVDQDGRSESMLKIKECVDVLLARRSVSDSDLRLPLRMLTTALVTQLENVLSPPKEDELSPYRRRSRYGYSQEYLQSQMIFLVQSLPGKVWLDSIEPSLANRATRAAIGVACFADDIDLALSFLKDGVSRSPSQAVDLADRLLSAWAEQLRFTTERYYEDFTPLRSYSTTYYSSRLSADGIVTRARERRNLALLRDLIEVLEAGGVHPRNLPSVAPVFIACHNRYDVFEAADILRVFGSYDTIPPTTSVALADHMRARLFEFWKAQSAPGAAAITAQVRQVMDQGYEVALAMVESATRADPSSWDAASLRQSIASDRIQFQRAQQGHDAKKLADLTRDAFEAFEASAALYARGVVSGQERESTQVYSRWFRAAMGASEVASLRAEEVPGKGTLQEAQFTKIRGALTTLPPDLSDRHLTSFAADLEKIAQTCAPEAKPHIVRWALAVLGDHPSASKLRRLQRYYSELINDEVKLRVTIDGPDTIQAGRPFGVMIAVRATTAVDADAQFFQYLKNNQPVYTAGQTQTVNFRDRLEDGLRSALGERFIIDAMVLYNELTPRAVVTEGGQPGWVEHPLAYAVLTPKDRAVDTLPQLTMDLRFTDTSGEVVLVATSNTPAIHITDQPTPRPAPDLELTQTIDTRDAVNNEKERAIFIEYRARAKGVIPMLEDLIEAPRNAPAGYSIPEGAFITKPILLSAELDPKSKPKPADKSQPSPYPERDDDGIYRIPVERTWTVTFKPDGKNPAPRLDIPTLHQGAQARLTTRAYTDHDILLVSDTSLALRPRSNIPFAIASIGAGAALVVGLLWWRRARRSAPAAPVASGPTMPRQITAVSTVTTLRRLYQDHALKLDERERQALMRDIEELEEVLFGPAVPQAAGPDLRATLERWVRAQPTGRVGQS